MSKKRAKKKVLKAVYVLLVILCLLCIMGMLLYLRRDHKEEEVAEEQHTEVVEQYVDEKAEEEKAELPIDFASLQQINPEIYAWIRIPDTNVDYPILQREDEDQSFYLDHDMYGEEQKAGSIYTECYNSKDFTDPNTIIYGHNMKNGSMFHNLRYFSEADFFEEHEELYIYLPDKILNYRIINSYEYDDRHILGTYDFSDEEVYGEYLEEIMNPRSMYTVVRENCELTTGDRIITLSTCVANKPNNRRLVQAVVVEEVEAEYKGITEE